MRPYIWTEISLAELEGYINKAVRLTKDGQAMQGTLIDVYEDGLYMEIGEGHVIFLDNDTYLGEDTRLEVVQVIEFPDL